MRNRGKCLGCAVRVSKCKVPPFSKRAGTHAKHGSGDSGGMEVEKGYDMVCSDGPVFKSEVIEWEKL